MHADFLTEKNKRDVSDINLYQLHISATDIIYLAERDENVTFGGQIYQASSVKRQDIESKKDGTLGRSSIVVPDVNGMVWAYILNNKETIKQMTVTVLTVWANHLDQPDACLEDSFSVVRADRNYTAVTFELQNPLVFDDILPRHFWSKTKCRHTYGDIYCGHTGGACNGTQDNCIANGNRPNFGGCPMMKRKWL
jgi:phage-related protein